jgi:hypothetical protein
MVDYQQILQAEFGAETGSFLLQLRTDLLWDKSAFDRLVAAMAQCANHHSAQDAIPRWVAEGFWYLDTLTRDWVNHPNFPKPHGTEYYAAAFERIRDLSYWLFVGEQPGSLGGA